MRVRTNPQQKGSMTDRYNYLTVALEFDLRSDDAQALIEAVKMLKGVLTVEPHVVNGTDFTSEARVRQEIVKKLIGIISPYAGERST